MATKFLNGVGKWLVILATIAALVGSVWAFVSTVANQNIKIDNASEEIKIIKPLVNEHDSKLKLLEKDISYIITGQGKIEQSIKELGDKLDRQDRPKPQ